MTTNQGPCPYVNRDDERCNSRLTLVHLPQAFGFCMAAYGKCAVYRQIVQEEERRTLRTELARSA